MPAPLITALPLAPSRADDGATFSTKADAFVAALPEFVSDANAQAAYLDGIALAADIEAANAAVSASSALAARMLAESAALAATVTAFSPTADYFLRVYLQSLSAPNAVFSDIPVSLGNLNLDLPMQTSAFADENIPLFRLNLATGNESINLEI